MKASTWWIIGAILFCAIVRSEILTMIALGCGLLPVALKLLEAAYDADHPSGYHYYED